MTVAISATSSSLDASIDPRFGRCQYFIIINSTTLDFEACSNTSKNAMSGAGISAAQILIDKNVQTVITGRIGPNARDVLDAAGIKIVTGASNTVRETLKHYLNGQLQSSPAASARDRDYRIGRGRNIGPGRGMGQRHGGKSQRGRLKNQTASPQASTVSMRQTATLSKKEEIQNLEAQAQQIQQQLLQLRKRLDK